MTKLLHVVGSPREALSRSEAVARAFLAEARRLNPGLELDRIDLWREDLPEFRLQPSLLTADPAAALAAAEEAARTAAARVAALARAA